ncbi:hypothetical protein [Robertmurraya sp.]
MARQRNMVRSGYDTPVLASYPAFEAWIQKLRLFIDKKNTAVPFS